MASDKLASLEKNKPRAYQGTFDEQIQAVLDKIMNQAGLDQTMQPLDFALVGNGFFQVDYGGQMLYTRNGAFALSVENGVPCAASDGQRYNRSVIFSSV